MMRKPASIVLCLVLSSVCVATAAEKQSGAAITVLEPDQFEYKSDPAAPGVGIALAAGNPKSGPYTLRVKFPAGSQAAPHRHPDTRTVTVLQGRYYLGVGERIDTSAMRPYDAGTVIIVPAGTPHYSAAREVEALVQESGVGPTGLEMIAPPGE